MKSRTLVTILGTGLISLGAVASSLWNKYEDRINVYTEPTLKLVTGLSIPCIEILSVDMPGTRWYSGLSRSPSDYTFEKLEYIQKNPRGRVRDLFCLGRNADNFILYENQNENGNWIVSDFYPKKKIFLEQLATKLPKLAEYLAGGNLNYPQNIITDREVSGQVSLESYSRGISVSDIRSDNVLRNDEVIITGVEFLFRDGKREEYISPLIQIKNPKKSLIKRLFRWDDLPLTP